MNLRYDNFCLLSSPRKRVLPLFMCIWMRFRLLHQASVMNLRLDIDEDAPFLQRTELHKHKIQFSNTWKEDWPCFLSSVHLYLSNVALFTTDCVSVCFCLCFTEVFYCLKYHLGNSCPDTHFPPSAAKLRVIGYNYFHCWNCLHRYLASHPWKTK